MGDSIEEIDSLELVLVGPNLVNGWELHKCNYDKIREVTIQFHDDLFDDKLLARRIFKPVKDMFSRSNHGIVFSKKVTADVMPRILKLSRIDSIDYFLELISILHDLAISRSQRLLSSYVAQHKNFENSEKLMSLFKRIISVRFP